MGKISDEVLKAYNARRNPEVRHLLCHAPFSNLNFEQNGNVTACCYNRTYVLGRYPDQSIEEIWFGEKAERLRGFIAENDLSKGCSACVELLEGGNYSGTKAVYYDEYAQSDPGMLSRWVGRVLGRGARQFPRVMELELSNTCNLECVMCNGYFSSAIRANREGLPAMECPYDRAFVKQMEAFVPHLTDLKLLGGEPFLIERYYEILEMVVRVKPSVRVHITTNGTVFNNRVKSLLSQLKFPGIVVSIDSVDKEGYEKIRLRGKFDAVMANITSFGEITSAKGTYLTLAVCPMRNNWRSLPEIVRFANDRGFGVHFNTLWTPEELSLRNLNGDGLEEVVTYLDDQRFNGHGPMVDMNIQRYREMVTGFRSQLESRNRFEGDGQNPHNSNPNRNTTVAALAVQFAINYDEGSQAKKVLYTILDREGVNPFVSAYFHTLLSGECQKEKYVFFIDYICTLDETKGRNAAKDIIERCTGMEEEFVRFVNDTEMDTLTLLIRSRYPSP